MLKMVIRMNDDKITAENKYRLDGIYNTINHTFQTVGLPRMEDGAGAHQALVENPGAFWPPSV